MKSIKILQDIMNLSKEDFVNNEKLKYKVGTKEYSIQLKFDNAKKYRYQFQDTRYELFGISYKPTILEIKEELISFLKSQKFKDSKKTMISTMIDLVLPDEEVGEKFIKEYNQNKKDGILNEISFKLQGAYLIHKKSNKKYVFKLKKFDNPGYDNPCMYDMEYNLVDEKGEKTITYFDSFIGLLNSGNYKLYNFTYNFSIKDKSISKKTL